MPPSLGDKIVGLGWATGAVLTQDTALVFEPYLTRPGVAAVSIDANDWLVIVSQTCDVVAQKIEQEPLVEFLHCRPILKLRSQHKDLRSTRILDFKPNRDTHADVVLSAHAVADRYNIPRDLLSNHLPDQARRLSPTSTRRVLEWYALRYTRPAWPDVFVQRISKAADSLEQILESLRDDIAEVRVSIREKDNELDDTDSYHIVVFFVVDEAVWEEDVQGRETIYQCFSKFVTKLNGCEGIEVDHDLSDVISGAQFSWQLMKSTDEWNFANLTYRD